MATPIKAFEPLRFSWLNNCVMQKIQMSSGKGVMSTKSPNKTRTNGNSVWARVRSGMKYVVVLCGTVVATTYVPTIVKPYIRGMFEDGGARFKEIDSAIMPSGIVRKVVELDLPMCNYSPVTGFVDRIEISPTNAFTVDAKREVLYIDKQPLTWLRTREVKIRASFDFPLTGEVGERLLMCQVVLYDNLGRTILKKPIGIKYPFKYVPR